MSMTAKAIEELQKSASGILETYKRKLIDNFWWNSSVLLAGSGIWRGFQEWRIDIPLCDCQTAEVLRIHAANNQPDWRPLESIPEDYYA